jgi:esterase/lipase superfamily enzyme
MCINSPGCRFEHGGAIIFKRPIPPVLESPLGNASAGSRLKDRSALQRKFGLSALFFAASLISGCGHPVGVMAPVAETAPGASVVDLLTVTTRYPSGDPATLYSGRRAPSYSLNEIKVSIPPEANRTPGEVQWPDRLPPDPAKDFAVLDARLLPSTKQAGAEWIGDNLTKSRDVLVFVHGFNNRYEEAVFRFAQIVHDSKMHSVPVLATWPSRGSLLA